MKKNIAKNKEAKKPAPKTYPPALLDQACEISGFCSTDKTRVAISGVHYDAEKQCVEATNGHIFIRVPLDGVSAKEMPEPKTKRTGLSASCSIPVPDLKQALKNAPKRCSLPVLEHVKLETDTPTIEGEEQSVATAYLTTTNLDTENTVSARAVEGKWPNIDQAIPIAQPKLTIALGAGLLKAIAEYALKNGQEFSSGVSVKFMFGDELDPVRFEIDLKETGALNERKATGVLMPMRLS